MVSTWTLPEALAVIFFATFIRSAFGFGEALVAVPLLTLIMPIEVAAPVAVLVSITVAGLVIAQDWRHIHVRSAGRLFLPTLVGTPLGLLLLTAVHGGIVKAALAIIIMTFSTYCLIGQRRVSLKDDRLAWIFGFGAGILGGAYGMNGPPLVIYGAFRGWSPQHLRATLQGYFLPASMIAMGGYWLAGLWTPAVTHYYTLALPAIVVAIVLGRVVNQRLNGDSFLFYVHIGLIVTSAILLFQSAGELGGRPARSPSSAVARSVAFSQLSNRLK